MVWSTPVMQTSFDDTMLMDTYQDYVKCNNVLQTLNFAWPHGQSGNATWKPNPSLK